MRLEKGLYYLISLLLLLGCKTSETIGEIPFTSVARGEFSNFQQGRHVIKSAVEWNSVLSGLNLPEIDFDKEMVLAVLSLRSYLNGTGVALVWQMLCEIAVGALAYLGTVLVLHRDRLVKFLSVIRRGQLDSGEPPAESPAQGAVDGTSR